MQVKLKNFSNISFSELLHIPSYFTFKLKKNFKIRYTVTNKLVRNAKKKRKPRLNYCKDTPQNVNCAMYKNLATKKEEI